MNATDTEVSINRTNLAIRAFLNVIFLNIIFGLCFFLPAMTFDYWQAWLYMGTFSLFMVIFLMYLLRNEPELLERRMQRGEERDRQRVIVRFANLVLLAIFFIPGFDQRFEWSFVPDAVVIVAIVGFVLSYLFFFLVLRENSYAARTVKVEEITAVITTGPYRIVRHPMYTSLFLMMTFTPLALASYWAFVILLPLLFILVYRVIDEEEMLSEELDGYVEYKQKTKYRIFPLIW